MYQAIVEDLDKRDRKSSNKIAQFIDNKSSSMPEFVRQGAHWLYLSEKTPVFQFVTQATQYSDFIARATEYQLLMEKGVKKDEALKTVLDAFVNYGKPASSFEEYLNDMGLIMFTKYMKLIVRAITKSGRKKPLNVILAILGQNAFLEIDDIWDQNLLTRSYSNLDMDMGEHLSRAFTPTAFQFAGLAD